MLSNQHFLRIPGPSPIPPNVQRAMSQSMIGHRSGDFKTMLGRIAPRLKPIFGTEQDVLILTSSGTSALEAAVVNTVCPGEEVLVLVSGAFGDRFVKICESYGIAVDQMNIPWGEAVDPQQVKERLKENPSVRAVFATYCETSTAVLNPVGDIAKAVKETSDALFIVDGVSCVGGVPAEMDKWGIDVLITGSQKAMMLPTGLAFVSVSERAWERIDGNDRGRFYLDLRKYRKSLADNSTPFTPAVSLLFGLEEVLNMFDEEGLDEVVKRHELMKDMTRSACKALGLPLLTSDADSSPTVTAVKPESFNAEDLRSAVKKEFALTLAGGQQHLTGQIFRIGHMGYCSPADVLQTIGMIEIGLHKIGAEVQLGAGVAAAQQVYVNGGNKRHDV